MASRSLAASRDSTAYAPAGGPDTGTAPWRGDSNQAAAFSNQEKFGNEYLAARLGRDSDGEAAGQMSDEEWARRLDAIEFEYRDMVETARALGFDVAADNLQFFLDGRGGVRELPVSWLRTFSPVVEAEETNQDRFEKQLQEAAESLGDGASVVIEDHWDRTLTAFQGTELYYASGTSTLTSSGRFELRREGDRVFVQGSVEHRWWDPYDWHPAQRPGFPDMGWRRTPTQGHSSSSGAQGNSTWKQGGPKPCPEQSP